MKLPRYSGLIVFLWISVVAFAAYAFLADPFKLSDDITIAQWNVRDFFKAKTNDSKIAKVDSTAVKVVEPEPEKRDVDSSAQRILLAGDSMAECLLYGMREYAKQSGHKIWNAAWSGSSTVKWAKSDSLEVAIKKYKPTLILFCLGANELTIPNIWGREKHLKTIIEKMDTTKFLWVSPPNWTEDTGLTEMISKNVPSEQLFISKDLKLDRRRDGAHPTIAASKIWADSVAKWIVEKSAYPIVLTKTNADKLNDTIMERSTIQMSSASAVAPKPTKSAGRKA